VKPTRHHLIALAALTALALVGCSERDPAGLEKARANVDPLVYGDDLSEDVYFQPFFETHYTAMSQDSVYAYDGFAPDGARSLKFQIPPDASALGPYTGGVLTSSAARDLTDFNALTFYARTDSGTATPQGVTLNEVGFGNDNTGNSLYGASRAALPLTWDWTFHVVPIPDSSKLISERGLFLIAEALQTEYRDGYNIWFDEIKYAQLDNIDIFRPMMNVVLDGQYFVGSTVTMAGARTVFLVDGAYVIVDHAPGYYDFVSADPAVVQVDGNIVSVVGVGESRVDATLQGEDVFGYTIVKGYHPPTVAATPPTLPAARVISMFSDVYSDVPVDTWKADWDRVTTQVEDYVVAGDNTKMYTSLNWVGIEFVNPTIDASVMTHFHLDVYAPAGTEFNLELVSFPADSDGVATEKLVLDEATEPAFISGGWSSLDIPLDDFVLREGFDWSNVGQLVLSSVGATLVLVDNVYWHD
jgi:hypothetical protein